MNLRTASAALVAAIALGSCGGSAPPPPEAAPAAAPKSEAISRADAMIADMKKRQAALEQSDRAVPGKAAKAPIPAAKAPTPAVVEPSPAAKPRPATRDTAPTTPITPTTPPVRSQMPRGVDVVSSNYTVAEQGKAF